MSKVIAYIRPDDGGVCIVIPTGELSLDAVLAKDVPPNAINVEVIDRSSLPADRTFRDAWKKGNGKVVVDMPKARQIHMSRIRAARDKELARLDVEWLKKSAQRKSAEADAIELQKQALRDIPNTFDLSVASNPEELKKLWPKDIPRE